MNFDYDNPKFKISENYNIVKRFNIVGSKCHTLIMVQ